MSTKSLSFLLLFEISMTSLLLSIHMRRFNLCFYFVNEGIPFHSTKFKDREQADKSETVGSDLSSVVRRIFRYPLTTTSWWVLLRQSDKKVKQEVNLSKCFPMHVLLTLLSSQSCQATRFNVKHQKRRKMAQRLPKANTKNPTS